MEYMALAIERDKSNLLKNARLKVSEWLDFENVKSNIRTTVYLEFSDSKKRQDLDHLYVIVPRSDFDRISFPTKDEIDEENRILKKKELSRMINIRGEYTKPIFVRNISQIRQNEEHILIRVDLEGSGTDDSGTRRFQFGFHIRNSFRKAPSLSRLFGSTWDWSYEAPISQLSMDENEFPEIVQIKTDLELWVMIEPRMYDSVSDLNIQSTRPFDRLVILPKDIAKKLERSPETLCMRWFFPDFSESGLGAEIIISKRRSDLEREKKYVGEINRDPNHFFSAVRQILSESRITCVDFEYISDRLEKSEFSSILEILFQLLYHRNDSALLRLEELVDILEHHQGLRYGRYYFQMFRLLHQMRTCEKVQDIIKPTIKKWLEDFTKEPEFTSKAILDLFNELIYLVDVMEQFYYYNTPEEKYLQKKEILMKIGKLRGIVEHRLINPESYILAEEILLKWEHLVEKEFEQLVGSQRLNVEVKTGKLLDSKCVHLIFDITNISDVPLVNLDTRLLPSEQYVVLEQEKEETTRRIRLTKSDERNKRVFSPEFVIYPKNSPHVMIQLEVKSFTEEGKKFTEVFDMEIELFHEDIEFKEIMQNPYIVGSPVKTRQMFYGREDVFEKIRRTIVGVSINQAIVYGQYRIGKTSVLYQLMNELRGKYVPVLVITHRLETGDSELLRFWSTQISKVIKDEKEKIPGIPEYEKLSNPYKGFQKYLEKIMDEIGEAKIIFMVDEYDLIDDLIQNGEISKEFFDLLDWMIKNDRVEPVMAGRLPMRNLKTEEWKKIARPFVQIRLSPLNRYDATKLIIEPVEDYMKYDDSAIERILRLTNCHPYLIQLCCHVLVNYHNSKKECLIGYYDVENCIPDIIELGSLGLEAMILADTIPEEQIVLRVMAAALKEQTSISEQQLVVRIREYNRQIEDRDVKNAILSLEEKEVIRSVTEELRRFKFVCDIFRYWIDAKMEPLRKDIPRNRYS